MPRYFFEITEAGTPLVDKIAMDFADLDEAKREALKALGEITAEDAELVAICIRDEHGDALCTVRVTSDDC